MTPRSCLRSLSALEFQVLCIYDLILRSSTVYINMTVNGVFLKFDEKVYIKNNYQLYVGINTINTQRKQMFISREKPLNQNSEVPTKIKHKLMYLYTMFFSRNRVSPIFRWFGSSSRWDAKRV